MTERVDALIIVARHEQLRAGLLEVPDEALVAVVEVLKLIDNQMLDLRQLADLYLARFESIDALENNLAR